MLMHERLRFRLYPGVFLRKALFLVCNENVDVGDLIVDFLGFPVEGFCEALNHAQ